MSVDRTALWIVGGIMAAILLFTWWKISHKTPSPAPVYPPIPNESVPSQTGTPTNTLPHGGRG